MPTAHTHAVVIGASMAGLASASALARRVDTVTIVERDQIAPEIGHRTGVPQARHLHVLMPGGQRALEQFLPGLGSDLEAAGAIPIEMPSDIVWLSSQGWMPRARGRLQTLSASRDLIERVTRAAVLRDERITLVDGVDATGLAVGASRQVVGVHLRPRSDPTARATTLHADLVVDASGRRSRASDWLEALGCGRPEETRIDAHLGYGTRLYRRNPALPRTAAFVQGRAPDEGRMAVLFPIEDDRWMLTMAGTGGDHPPTDEAGYAAFAEGMRDPLIARFLKTAEPISPIWGWAHTENRRRHFERMRPWPDGFLVIGDAACAFNPVYGQGMSVAAKSALAVDQLIAEHQETTRPLGEVARAAQAKVAKVGEGPWMLATGEDLRYPTTTGGQRRLPDRILDRYVDRVLRTATHNPQVALSFVDVLGMVAEPTSLLHPRVVARVLVPRRATSAPRRVDDSGLAASDMVRAAS